MLDYLDYNDFGKLVPYTETVFRVSELIYIFFFFSNKSYQAAVEI